jgi:hypothetical protein
MFIYIPDYALGILIAIAIDLEDYDRVAAHHWCLTSNRQIIGSVGGHSKILSRFLLDYSGGLDVDHIDNNPANNTKPNLRLATREENLRNRNKFASYGGCPTLSRLKGVTYDWVSAKWKAQLGYKGAVVYLGLYPTELEAAIAYNNAAKQYFGEFARLNALPDMQEWGNLDNPMTLVNLIRLLQCANEKHAVQAMRMFIHTNPILPTIPLPDPTDLYQIAMGSIILRNLAVLSGQPTPFWCLNAIPMLPTDLMLRIPQIILAAL